MEREKFVVNKDLLNDEELRTGRVSYNRIIERYVHDIILCNNVAEIDNSIWDNVENLNSEDDEIYQYYLCNLSKCDKEALIDYGIIVSYSDMLDLDVIMVDHWGTSWDYVMTDIEWVDTEEYYKNN